ncbi:MAG: response regulator transcription factor [Anaerolineae bacterium]
MENKILLIDDDLLEAEKIQASLQRAGFQVQMAPPSRKALRMAQDQGYALVILSLNGHSASPQTFSNSLRRAIGFTPLVFVPPVGVHVPEAENQRVLNRPATTRRILYYVRRLLSAQKPRPLQVGDLTLDYENQCVWKGEEKHLLTPKEFRLLEFFMSRPREVLSKKQILEAVWDTTYMGYIRTIYVHVRWLRKKLEADPCRPEYIRTVRGVGYVFSCPEQPPSP